MCVVGGWGLCLGMLLIHASLRSVALFPAALLSPHAREQFAHSSHTYSSHTYSSHTHSSHTHSSHAHRSHTHSSHTHGPPTQIPAFHPPPESILVPSLSTGIPLAAATAVALAQTFEKDVPYCYNRKEAKDHGEGGSIVGAPLQGRVLVVNLTATQSLSTRFAHPVFLW